MDPHAAAVTLCAAAAAGIFLTAVAERARLPSIAVLLVGGLVLGPEVLGWVRPATLGSGLETVVTLAVAVILFEGGLTLDVAGFRREPKVIVRMLTLGVLVTWIGTALTIWLVYGDVPIELAIIAGSLVIVTGPTVVSPLLRRIGIQPRLHHILYWEGVLVDAVGVFVAVLCYEWIASSAEDPMLAPLGRFASRFVVGAGVGLAIGLGLAFVLRRRWVSQPHANIVVVGSALLALGLANSLLHESGILAVIVAGFVVSLRAPELKEVKRFKLELTEMAIGLLFVLLAAKLDIHQFVDDAGRLAIVLAVILFAIRPIDVLISTAGQPFSWRERAFLSWLAPRGIVAASMASLFALRLGRLEVQGAELLETITYAVIGTTVIAQGLTAPTVARLLGLKRASRSTWLLIGDPTLAVALHRQLRRADARSLVLAAQAGRGELDVDVELVLGDPLEPGSIRDPRIADVEAVVALARDPDLNVSICDAWIPIVGVAACYRWVGATDDRADDAPGRPIGRDLPPPAEVAAGIEGGACAIEAIEVGTPEDARRFGPGLAPLLAVDDQRIAVAGTEAPIEAGAVVAFHRRVPGLYGLVRDADIIDQRTADLESVIRGLLEMAAHGNPAIDVEHHLAEILERERTMSTAVGHGVAIPHVYDDNVPTSCCYVANVIGGLDLLGPDDEPVKLVFLVISPSGQAGAHLRGLAAIAHLASDLALVEVLCQQRTRGRLLTLLRERE